MDRIQIKPKNSIQGHLQVPPSKSYAQRALAIAGLAQNNITIHGVGYNDDVLAAQKVLQSLGAEVMVENDTAFVLREIDKSREEKIEINCGESGLSTRLFSTYALLFEQDFKVVGEGSIQQRTMSMVIDGLKQFGKTIISNQGKLPMTISGKTQPRKVIIDGSVSSQFITGILIVAPFLPFDTEIEIKNLKSKPYIHMTVDLLRRFNLDFKQNGLSYFYIYGNQEVYRPIEYTVEGDWSAASFFVVAATIGGKVQLSGLKKYSKQGDKEIVNLVEQVGAIVVWDKEELTIERNKISPFEFDATECPDLFPPLAVLASFANGKSIIKGVHRLIHKESNRALALQEECAKVGVKIEIENDEMVIYGNTINVHEGTVFNAHKDHRIAMAMSLYALASDVPFTIEGASAVNKSYPSFYADFNTLK